MWASLLLRECPKKFLGLPLLMQFSNLPNSSSSSSVRRTGGTAISPSEGSFYKISIQKYFLRSSCTGGRNTGKRFDVILTEVGRLDWWEEVQGRKRGGGAEDLQAAATSTSSTGTTHHLSLPAKNLRRTEVTSWSSNIHLEKSYFYTSENTQWRKDQPPTSYQLKISTAQLSHQSWHLHRETVNNILDPNDLGY